MSAQGGRGQAWLVLGRAVGRVGAPMGPGLGVRPRPTTRHLAGLPLSWDLPQGTMQTQPEHEALFLLRLQHLGGCPRDS